MNETSTETDSDHNWNQAVDWLLNRPIEMEDRAGFDCIANGLLRADEAVTLNGAQLLACDNAYDAAQSAGADDKTAREAARRAAFADPFGDEDVQERS